MFILLVLGADALAQREIPQELVVTADWILLEPGSAVSVRRAVDKSTGQPFRALPKFSKQLSRKFYLRNSRSVFGEPFLIEYRVQGTDWVETVGGNYRGSGRDDNFCFLLRSKSTGQWSPDRYGKVFHFGGLSVDRKIQPDTKFSYWHPLSRWTYPSHAGDYELHCLMWDNQLRVLDRQKALNIGLPPGIRFDNGKGLMDSETGLPLKNTSLKIDFKSQPLAASPIVLPEGLRAELKKRERDTSQICLYERFDIELIDADPNPLLRAWMSLAEPEGKTWPDDIHTAARTAMWFNSKARFLSFLEEDVPDASSHLLTGLAMNESPLCVHVMLQGAPQSVLGALHRLLPKHRSIVEPWLNDLVGDEGEFSSQAAGILKGWER